MSVIPGNMIEPDDTVAFRQSGIPSTERKFPVEPSTPDASSVNASILTSDCSIVSDEIESNVLVIYTGGTIGMVKNAEGVYEPIPNALATEMKRYPNMHDEEFAKSKFSGCRFEEMKSYLVLPLVNCDKQERRIIYRIHEYTPLLDSSNMTVNDWMRIAKDIESVYDNYDGFVILHGTDTLAYTASALSFMCENLGKTIVITGSQIPIFETRTDGKDNFISALILAGNYIIPEVVVVFGSKVMRANRTIKHNSGALEAFTTPNSHPLGEIGVHVNIDWPLVYRPSGVEKFRVFTDLNVNIGIFRIFPSMTEATIKAVLSPPIEGVVLQTFGAGNIPTRSEEFLKIIKEACDRGVIIINCTQCVQGTVSGMYDTGKQLYDQGAIPGSDLTTEAAFTKLSYVLGKKEWSLEHKKAMMQTNLRGEMSTTNEKDYQIKREFDLIDAVARSLNMTTLDEISQLEDVIFPAMVNSAVIQKDLQKIEQYQRFGAKLAAVNHDGRTALHIASREGSYEIVKYLLSFGVPVHVPDKYNRTALMEAISSNSYDIIRLLVKCGAYLTGDPTHIGDHLSHAVVDDNIKKLEAYRIAGANLEQEGRHGRSPLHVAALHAKMRVVTYLTKYHVNHDKADKIGLTPLDYARLSGCKKVIGFFENLCNNNTIVD